MIYDFYTYAFKSDLEKLLFELNNSNEDFSVSDLTEKIDKIYDFLNPYVKMGGKYLNKFLTHIYNNNKGEFSNTLVLITLVLMVRFGMPEETLFVKTGGKTPTKEELVAKAKAKLELEKKELGKFLKALAEKESTNDPTKINKLGYIGKYQFGEIALKDIKADKKINYKNFKKNHKIWPEKEQDKAMIKLMKRNIKYLGDYLKDYDGKIIADIEMTKSGMLAAAHLLGASNVKKFINTNGKHNPKDGFGTKLTDYIKKFNGYKFGELK